jgi:hypothetical protein
MALQFTASEWIGASQNVVYGVATNLELAGKWMPNFIRMEKLTHGEFGPGTKFRETRKFYGKTASEVFEVVAADPPRRVTLSVDGTLGTSKRGHYEYTFEFVPEDEGTRVDLTGSIGKLSWLMQGIGRVFLGSMRKACVADLRAMKAYIESQSPMLRHSTASMPAFTPPNAVRALRRDD